MFKASQKTLCARKLQEAYRTVNIRGFISYCITQWDYRNFVLNRKRKELEQSSIKKDALDTTHMRALKFLSLIFIPKTGMKILRTICSKLYREDN